MGPAGGCNWELTTGPAAVGRTVARASRNPYEGGLTIKICPKDKTEYGDDISFCPICGTRCVSVGLRKGEVVGGSYRIVDLIGRGWAGAVYRAEHSMMGRPTALKVVSSPVVADPAFIERFRKAAHLLSELDSPQVAMVHDLGLEPPNKIFIASELVAGRSLAKMLADEGPIPAQKFVGIMRVVLEGLKSAHDMGLVHGSMKPSNVIVAGDRAEPKIVDFGARRIVAALQDELFAVQTSKGLIYGEIAHLAPEQILGEEVDPRSDIYCLGLMMYELLTGAKPFRHESPEDMVRAQLEDKPVPPREFKPQLKTPKFIEKAVMQALEKKPRRRQQSAAELLEELSAEIVPEEEEHKGVWQRAKAAMAPKPAPPKEEAPAEATPQAEAPAAPTRTVRVPRAGVTSVSKADGEVAVPAVPAAKAAVRAPVSGEKEEEPEEVSGPRLVLYEGKVVKSIFPLDKPELLVGRSPECDIMIDDRTVSRVHARISVKPERVVVEDLNSLNGTYINNDAVKRGHIEDKDTVAFGNISLVFRT